MCFYTNVHILKLRSIPQETGTEALRLHMGTLLMRVGWSLEKVNCTAVAKERSADLLGVQGLGKPYKTL